MAEVDKILCPKCEAEWEILPGETRCGYCGEKILSFKLDLEDKIIYTDNGLEKESLRLTIANDGIQKLQIEKIYSEDTWIEPEDKKDEFLLPGEKIQTSISLDLPKAQKRFGFKETIVGKVCVKVFEDDNPETKSILILSPPEFELKNSNLTLKGRKNQYQPEDTLKIELDITKGEMNIEDIEGDKDWIKKIEFSKKNVILKRGNLISPVILTVDTKKLDADESKEATLSFKLTGRQTPENKMFKVTRHILPELSLNHPKMLSDSWIMEIRVARAQEYSLNIKNEGGGKLTINKIEIEDKSITLITPLPVDLNANEPAKKLDFVIDTTDLKLGNYETTIIINSNCCVNPVKRLHVTIIVKEAQLYNYYVGIDFGTTNSCCAWYNEKNDEIELIPLDVSRDSEIVQTFSTLPSLIAYTGINNKKVKYLVGFSAQDLLGSKRHSVNVVESIKRWLGQDETRRFLIDGYWIELAPRQIAKDIIKHMIEKIEDHLDKGVKKCVICHPGKFSARQINDLRWILKEIGIEKCILIDEASAGALDYILQRNMKKKEPEEYTLVVYDFGGGTIDLTLAKVIVKKNGKKYHIIIETLDVDGERWFGGDDVTQAVVDLIIEKYNSELKKTIKDNKFNIPYLKKDPKKGEIYQPSEEEEIDEAKTYNTRRLYGRGEDMKKELTERESATMGFNLKIDVNGTIRWTTDLLDRALDIEIHREELNEKIKPNIEKTFQKIQNMLSEAKLEHPDVIVLSGQSSVIPLVEEVLKRKFEQSEITGAELEEEAEKIEKRKKCVARGACRYGIKEILSGGCSIERKDFANKTHSRFGIKVSDEFDRRIFQEIIGKKLRIPDESKGEIVQEMHRETLLPVIEHTGTGTTLSEDETEIIAAYTIEFPEDILDEDLKECLIEMNMQEDESIDLIAKVKNNKFKFHSDRMVSY